MVVESQKMDSCGAAGSADNSIQVKRLQVPAKWFPVPAVSPPPTAAGSSKGIFVSDPSKVLPVGHIHQPSTSTAPEPGRLTSSPSVMVVAKVAPSGGVAIKGTSHATRPPLSHVVSLNQTTTPGRTVVITVPRAAGSQTVPVAPRLPHTGPPQLPANIQIPPGMMLIRSDSGQLMLVSQQALAQAQQAPRGVCGQAPRILIPQVSSAAGNKNHEKVTVIRMTAPPAFHPAPVQKTAVVKVNGETPKPAVVQALSAVSDRGSQPLVHTVITEPKKETAASVSQATLESVKKCKNFLVTLIKLASSDSRSANMANNVRGLVRSLLEGKLEAEEFTEQLYRELKSTPQPCLVPFLKKSLPAVRRLTADPHLFIQQASTSTGNLTKPPSSTTTGQPFSTSQQLIKQPPGVTLRPGMTTLVQSRNYILKSSRPIPKQVVVQSGKPLAGLLSLKQPFTQEAPHSIKFAFKDSSGSYKEDDDINDVASMAGVNLREENARILTSGVGSVVQSCQDQLFLSPSLVLSRILLSGRAFAVTDVGPNVVALVSHATQECLRGLLEKLTVMAEHRKAGLKEDLWHAKVSDVRSQLRFLEEVESLKKKRRDEEEREHMLRLARSRSHTEDPHQQQLKQRAKELQQMEEAQLQQREANLAALAAIGPRKKRPLEPNASQVTLLPRPAVERVTRVMLRDLLLCMEQHHFLCHSLSLYRAML
ncbi:transcription initiation factor TFIID subunit 4 isoform X2 [Gasterosteus aculeatus]